jgi:glutathione S-transferase
MNPVFANPAFRLYAISSTIIALQLVALALYTGMKRVMSAQFINPEDGKGKIAPVAADPPAIARIKRAHQNAIENAIPFFIVGALYAATGGTKSGALAYFGSFTAARIFHSIFYLWGKQPFRTLSFAVGVIAIVGMSLQVILSFTHKP